MFIRLFVIVVSALLIATAIVNAQEARPALRAEAIVTGPLVRIGDLVDNAGIVANTPVFRSPALGETGSVPVGAVLEALRAHALIGLDTGSITQVTVTRASRAIAAEEIEGLVAAALGKEQGLGDPKDITVTFDRAMRAIHLEPNVKESARISRLRYDARSGRFDATLEFAGIASATTYLVGTAIATQEVVTLTRALNRGEIIKPDDLAVRRVPRARVSGDAILNPEKAVGLAVRNAASTERPLRAADLMKPEIVQRGEFVTILYEVPGVMLSIRGKAAEGGAQGDTIEIVNVQSNRTVRGTVTGPGQVSVLSITPRVVAAADISVRNSPVTGGK